MPLDFVTEWDYNEKATSEKIIVDYIERRLDAGMPIVVIIYGKSRSGKSRLALKISDALYKRKGIDFATILQRCVLIKPEDWDTKAREIFEQKEPISKQICTIQLDEAKFILNAADWQSLKNRTIQTIAATSASIKPVCFFVIAQLLKDVNNKTRETSDLIIRVHRTPRHAPNCNITIPYERILDISTIKVCPRVFNGLVKYPDGTKEHIMPVFQPTLPRKEVDDIYAGFETTEKTEQIFQVFDELRKQRQKLKGDEENKVKKVAEYLIDNIGELEKIAAFKRQKWKLGLSARKRFEEFTEREIGTLERLVNDGVKIKAMEMVKDGVATTK